MILELIKWLNYQQYFHLRSLKLSKSDKFLFKISFLQSMMKLLRIQFKKNESNLISFQTQTFLGNRNEKCWRFKSNDWRKISKLLKIKEVWCTIVRTRRLRSWSNFTRKKRSGLKRNSKWSLIFKKQSSFLMKKWIFTNEKSNVLRSTKLDLQKSKKQQSNKQQSHLTC